MSIYRIFVLFKKEIKGSSSNFLVVFAVFVPVILSLLVTLFFGDLFSDMPRLGFIDPGDSDFVNYLSGLPHLRVENYSSLEILKKDVESGIIETGIILPADFDGILKSGESHVIEAYTWGETLYKHRLIADTAIANAAAEIAGLKKNVRVGIIQLGEANIKNLADQFLPVLVIMTIIMGGVLIPAISMIEEKQNRTLLALNITPARLWEIYSAKALLGICIGILTALITLAINKALGDDPFLLFLVLFLGSLAASLTGILLGSLLKDMNILLAVLKSGGILLIAPAIIDFVPKAPEWIARIFPTYYMLNPVIEVAVRSADLNDISGNLLVLAALIGTLLVLISFSIEKKKSPALMG